MNHSVLIFPQELFDEDRKIREWKEEGEANAVQLFCAHKPRNTADRTNKSEFIYEPDQNRTSGKVVQETTDGSRQAGHQPAYQANTETPKEVIDEITQRCLKASEESDPDLPEGCEEWNFHSSEMV